jgi:hypothetical protein
VRGDNGPNRLLILSEAKDLDCHSPSLCQACGGCGQVPRCCPAAPLPRLFPMLVRPHQRSLCDDVLMHGLLQLFPAGAGWQAEHDVEGV